MNDNPTQTTPVVTRIAPSPTGSFHIGTARTALFNYLFARHHGGTFIVRFEDTDRKRSREEHERDILDALTWLGLEPDRTERQSERGQIYKKHIEVLLEHDHAYRSREPSKDNPEEETEVIRFRNRNPIVTFTDTLRGEIEIDTTELGDFVIARGIDDPLYNLAVVIDDTDMGVTHVLRGDDHIINTPRQILLTRAIGGNIPVYTHIPLIHSPTGGKLSKRKDAVSVTAFRERGYLPEALINTIALLGWNPKSDREIFTLAELIEAFSAEHIQKKEAVFDEKKLLWFNRKYMKEVPEKYLREELEPALAERFSRESEAFHNAVSALCQGAREQGTLLGEVREGIAEGAYDFFFTDPVYPAEMLVPKGGGEVRERLEQTQRILDSVGEWNETALKDALWGHAEEYGKSLVLWPLRVALSGKERSPGPFTIAAAIGRERTRERIDRAITLLTGDGNI